VSYGFWQLFVLLWVSRVNHSGFPESASWQTSISRCNFKKPFSKVIALRNKALLILAVNSL
jgi:hypothetical protein